MNPALVGSLVCSAVYRVTVATGRCGGRWIVKAAATALLAVFVRRYPLLTAALALSAVGDALLDIDPGYFVIGLVAFLCAHLVYITCFARTERVGSLPPLITAAALAYALGFAIWIVPATGS